MKEKVLCEEKKRRRLFWLLTAVIFAVTVRSLPGTALTASAENAQKIADMADLLDDEEEEKLQKQFAEIAEQYQCDVAVVTTDSCGGKSPRDYTDDYYEANDYGYGDNYDGILLMVSIGDRRFHMATQGAAIDIFTEYGLEKIDGLISGKLSDGDYYGAFKTFGNLAGEFMAEAEKGTPFDYGHEYKGRMALSVRLLIASAAGLIAAFAVVAALLWQLRSVRGRGTAQDYVREGSFHLTHRRDVFLYRTVSRIRKEKPQNHGGGGSMTHTTSGGRSAGGHTGSF